MNAYKKLNTYFNYFLSCGNKRNIGVVVNLTVRSSRGFGIMKPENLNFPVYFSVELDITKVIALYILNSF